MATDDWHTAGGAYDASMPRSWPSEVTTRERVCRNVTFWEVWFVGEIISEEGLR